MRKFFAILLALFLAFTVFVLYGAKKQGIPFRELNAQKIKQVMTGFREQIKNKTGQKNPDQPAVEVISEPEEENLSYDERMSKGNYFFDRGFLSFAVEEYVKAANLEPKKTEPYLKLLQTHYTLGNYEKARQNADTVLILEPGNTQALYFLVEIHSRQGNFTEAETILNQLTASGLEDPRLDYQKALISILSKRYDEAKKQLEKAKAGTADPELQGKIDKLLTAYQEFEFAKSAEVLYLEELLARGLNQNKEYELALFKLKEILRTRSDLRDAWILMGFAYLNLEKHYFALTSFQRAYEIDSQWPATQYFLGVTYQELEDFNQAIVYFNYALSNQFEPPLVIRQKLADLYIETKNYEAAATEYQKILKESQGDISAFIKPIWLYLDLLGKPEEALKLAELAMVSFPENPMALNLLGWSQTGTGQYAEAEKNLKKAFELDPKMAAASLNLGRLYELQEKKTESMEAYKKAYDLDPNGSIGQRAAQKYNELLNAESN